MRLGFLVLVTCWRCDRHLQTRRSALPPRRLATGARTRRACAPDHARRPAGAFCNTLGGQHVTARARNDAAIPKRRRVSRSIFSPAVSTLHASFASRRTATSSSPKPERGACSFFTAAGAGAGPAQGEIFADGVPRVYGIAFYPSGQDPRFVYVATSDFVVRFPYRSGEMKASGPAEKDRQYSERRQTPGARPRVFA